MRPRLVLLLILAASLAVSLASCAWMDAVTRMFTSAADTADDAHRAAHAGADMMELLYAGLAGWAGGLATMPAAKMGTRGTMALGRMLTGMWRGGDKVTTE